MSEWARGFGDYVAAIAGGVGVALIAALGTELALFPEESEVTWERTASNSYRIAWQNGFPNRRSRENAMSAAFELFRNGDIAITTNNVTRYIERELPFDCAGRGQDAAWVAANYPNDAEAIANMGGYAAWVDEKVGVGLENGLYRFTATFPTEPLEAIELFVGPYTVAVTNAGDYVFLLEKGRDYIFGMRPFIAGVTYAAVDDLGVANNALRCASNWRGDTWSTAGGGLEWTLPTETIFGKCCWLPYFQGAPDLPYLSTGAFPSVFEGVLSDAVEGLGASYEWRADYHNLEIKSPNERETEVAYKEGADSRSYALSVTATLGEHKLTSIINGHYWTNSAVEAASITASAPKVLLLPSNAVKEGQDTGVITIDLKLPEGENGVLSLECERGAGKVQLVGETSWQVSGSTTKEVRIVGESSSNYKDDVKLVAKFVSDDGEPVTCENLLTVIKIWHEALAPFPENRQRNCFGIAEEVYCFWEPSNLEFSIECNNGNVSKKGYGFCKLRVALEAGTTVIVFNSDDLKIVNQLEVLAPQNVVAIFDAKDFQKQENVAGGIEVKFRVYVTPLTVSFSLLQIQELPRIATDATGYFAQAYMADALDHGKHGAGHWIPLSEANTFLDTARIDTIPPPWMNGASFTWPIPCVWRYDVNSAQGTEFVQYNQRFELDANGTVRIKKFGYCAERATNSVFHISGGSL